MTELRNDRITEGQTGQIQYITKTMALLNFIQLIYQDSITKTKNCLI